MNFLGRLARLGHALVSWGLAGPGAGGDESAPLVLPCPTVRVAVTSHTAVAVEARALASARLSAAGHTVVRSTTDC